MKQKILIVDSDRKSVEVLKKIFSRNNFTAISASGAEQAMSKIKEFKPDLALLDVDLPGISGYDLCRIIKKENAMNNIPIIMIAGRAVDVREKVEGLQAGADDFLVKPYAVEELIARVHAVIRRYHLNEAEAELIEKGPVRLNLADLSVRVSGKNIDLRPKEFDLLYLLMKKAGRVLDRPYILEAVWGYEYVGTNRTVDVHIRRLREKLGKNAAEYIQTIESKGYIFIEK